MRIITVILIYISAIVAGINSFGREYNKGNYLTADTAKYKITYHVSVVRDTAFRESVKTAYLVTLIGNRTAKVIDHYELESDLLVDSLIAKNVDASQISEKAYKIIRSNRFFNEQIILDYPAKGVNLFQTSICASWFRVYDDDCKQNWQLTGDTRDILGYECRKAVCDFRGRSYEAWYTDEVPIPRGPYYFQGLPGLIIELYDTERDYIFSMVGLECVSGIIPINMYEPKSLEVTSREDLRYVMDYYAQDPAAAIMASPFGGQVELTPELLKRINRPRPYNPIERK